MAQHTRVMRTMPYKRHSPFFLVVLFIVAAALMGAALWTALSQNTAPAVPQLWDIQQGAVRVTNLQVVQEEVAGFDPSLLPVKEGFYNGDRQSVFKLFTGSEERPRVNAAAARDQNTVLVATEAVSTSLPQNAWFLLLSLGGTEPTSWCNLLLTPGEENLPDSVRVVNKGGVIRLYGQHPGRWWEAAVTRSELPCL